MTRLKRKQQEFIAQMYSDNAKKLSEFMSPRLIDPSVADDLVQDAFIIATYRINSIMTYECPYGFLSKIAVNLTMRANKRALRLAAHEDTEYDISTIEGPGLDDPFDMLIPTDMRPEDREILTLRCKEALNYHEIAHAKGIADAAARKRFSRATERLKKKYLEDLNGTLSQNPEKR